MVKNFKYNVCLYNLLKVTSNAMPKHLVREV